MIDILSSGRAKARMPRSLILAPTRELAAQVSDNFVKYGKNTNLSMALLIGGVSFADQEQKLDRGVDVLIATPGRLLDHFERGKVLLTDVKILVIDEADRMLDMGFIPDIERIIGLLPKIRQTMLFSATMVPEIRRLADQFMMNPKSVSVAPPASTADTVVQHASWVPMKGKREALRQLINSEDVTNAVIFCNRKRDCGVLHRSLVRHNFDAVVLHGDMSQPARMETLQKFKDGEARLLVASDVAARGLDIAGRATSSLRSADEPGRLCPPYRSDRSGGQGRPGFLSGYAGGCEVPVGHREIDREIVPAHEIMDGSTLKAGEVEEAGEEARSSRRRRGRGRGEDKPQKPQSKPQEAAEEKPPGAGAAENLIPRGVPAEMEVAEGHTA